MSATRFLKQQRLPILAANHCATVDYKQLMKTQTHTLFLLAYNGLAASVGENELSKTELEDEETVCSYSEANKRRH